MQDNQNKNKSLYLRYRNKKHSRLIGFYNKKSVLFNNVGLSISQCIGQLKKINININQQMFAGIGLTEPKTICSLFYIKKNKLL